MLPMAALVAYDIVEAANASLERANRDTMQIATAAAADVDTFARETERALAALAARPKVRTLDPQRCDPILREVPAVFPALKFPDFNTVGIRDTSGNMICSIIADPVPADVVRRSPAFKRAVSKARFDISDAFLSPVSKRWIAMSAHPVHSDGGTRTGLIFLRLDLRELQDHVLSVPPGDVAVAVFDREGRYLMRWPDPDRWIGRPAGNAQAMKARALKGLPGFERMRGSDGIERIYAFHPVARTGWMVGAGVPADAVVAPYRARLWQGAALGLVALALAAALALRIGSAIARPVRALARTAERIAGGDRGARAPGGGPPEVALVAGEFNRMLDAQAVAERLARRQSDFYAALSQTNQAIVRMHDPDQLYEEICRICVEFGHSRLAFIALVDGERFMPVAWAGEHGGFLDGIVGAIQTTDPGSSGPIATALRTGEHYVSNDFLGDPRTEPWRERASVIGTRATAAFPFSRGGKVAGALSLHVTDKDFFNTPLVALLDEMAGDLSFGLDNYDRGVAQDLAQQEVRAAYERFRKIFHAAPMPMSISLHADGTLTDVNDAYCRWFGAPREDIIGATSLGLGIWLHPEERPAFKDKLDSGLGVHDSEHRFRIRSGEVRDALVNAEMIEFLGAPQALVIITDLTERKRAEQMALDLNATLERRVAERTSALEAANRELDSFGRTIAHDLRAPLRSISRFNELLRQAAPGEAAIPAYAGRIAKNVARMDTMLTDLLNFARFGRATLAAAPIDMNALVASVAEDLAAEAPQRPEIVVSDLPGASGDASLLRQVWANLISNAVKYSSKTAQPRIEIGARKGKDEVEYYVRDNGCGFDPAYSDKLFEVFQRLHSESEYEGNGIGLAIVHRIVERHGGRVFASSKPGEGAEFGFTLPTNDAP